jgi:23S rRNA (uracil1939-C5)-methyltransferase
MNGERVELRIDAIAAGGDGVGREADGRVVFVPLTAPGERVRAEVVTAKKTWARARLLELLERAPDRRDAPCPVFGICGGCRLQHLPESRQATAKRAIVAAALRRIGGIDADVPEPIRVGEPFGYRNRVTLTVRRGDEAGREPVRAGFFGLHEPDRVVDCPNCLLAEEPVRKAWAALAPFDVLPAGKELRVTIRASAEGGIALLVEGGESAGDRDAVVERLPNLESYWWIDEDGVRCQLAGRTAFVDEWRGLRFDLDPGVFLQVNRRAAEAMDDWLDGRVREAAGRRIDGIGRMSEESLRGLRVADLYAGVGVRAIRWARAGATVVTCEVDGAACAASQAAARKAGARIEVHRGRVEDNVELLRTDLVVVNPPRAGLAGPVRAALAAGPARHVAYVSCDPATLARDLSALSGAYRVAEIQPFDVFPQTAHVETIAWLRRLDAVARPDPADAAEDEAA